MVHFLRLTLVAEESRVSLPAPALEGALTVAVKAPAGEEEDEKRKKERLQSRWWRRVRGGGVSSPWQAHALRAVRPHPADLADALVRLGALPAALVAGRVAHRVAAVVVRVAPPGHADQVALGVADVVLRFLGKKN